MRIPVIPADIAPPSPRTLMKLPSLRNVIERKSISGKREVQKKFAFFERRKSYLKKSLRINEWMKKLENIVKIPRMRATGPRDIVATSLILLPRTPTTVREKIM